MNKLIEFASGFLVLIVFLLGISIGILIMKDTDRDNYRIKNDQINSLQSKIDSLQCSLKFKH